jgi:pimeloyl-ACP methyl ester carboxylesterase
MGTGLDLSCWDAQVQAYSGEFDCLRFDNRGTGHTTAPDVPFTVPDLADDAAALLDTLGIAAAHVSGLSLGSCVAQELALRHPSRVKSLQLHGTWARARGYAERKFKAQLRLLERLDTSDFYDINVLWFMTPEYMQQHPDRVEEQLRAIVRANPSKELLSQQYRADLQHDTLGRLRDIRVPTLVTVGSFDTATPPVYARQVAEEIPEAELVVFEGGGHLHNIEQPEEFNRVTLDFLTRHSPAVGEAR